MDILILIGIIAVVFIINKVMVKKDNIADGSSYGKTVDKSEGKKDTSKADYELKSSVPRTSVTPSITETKSVESKPAEPERAKIVKSVSGSFTDIPKDQRVSISKIKDSKCPFKYFKNYIEEPKQEIPFLSIELGLGNYFHTKVERLFKTIAARKRLVEKGDCLDAGKIINDFEMSFLWNNKLRKPYKIIRHDFDYFKDRLFNIVNNFNRGVMPKLVGHKILKAEGAIQIKTDDYTIRGKYDLLTQDHKERVFLWDWKTGAAPKPEYYEDFVLQKIQLGIYAIWVRYKYNTKNVRANAVFLREDADFLHEVFEEYLEQKVVDFINSEYEDLKNITEYYPIKSNLCSWCGWNPECPA